MGEGEGGEGEDRQTDRQTDRQISDLHCSPGNFDHGAWKSGDKLEAKRDAFAAYLTEQSEDYYERFAESVARDKGELFDSDLDPAGCMSEWMSSKSLRNRGQYATHL